MYREDFFGQISSFFATSRFVLTEVENDFVPCGIGLGERTLREEMGLMGLGGNLERGDFERFVDGRKNRALEEEIEVRCTRSDEYEFGHRKRRNKELLRRNF